MRQIENGLVFTMIRKAQKVGLSVKRGDSSQLVTSLKEIGEAFKKDESIECALKINYVMNDAVQIGVGYDVYAEQIVMNHLNIKYLDDEKVGKGSVVRMTVKRR